MTRRRRLLVGGVALLLALLAPPVAVYVDARSDAARERKRVDAEIAEERARLSKLRLPCLRGAPLDEPGRARLEPLLALGAELADPATGLKPPETRERGVPLTDLATLERHKARLAPLREALRCTRSSPPSFEIAAKTPSLLAWRGLFHLLLTAASERDLVDDEAACVELGLDAARLALVIIREADTGAGPLDDAALGADLLATALRFLGERIAAQPVDEALRRQIVTELDLLHAALPTAREVWNQHGLARRRELCASGDLTGLANTHRDDDHEEALAAGWWRLVPRSFLVARALPEIDALVTTPVVPPADDRRAPDEWVGHIERATYDHWNPFVRVFCQLSRCNVFAECRAREALLRGAIALDDGAAELPADPCSRAGEPLHCSGGRAGESWRIWSVGRNGRDDQGWFAKNGCDDFSLARPR